MPHSHRRRRRLLLSATVITPPTQLIIPSGYNGGTLPFNVFRSHNGIYTTDFNINSFIPPITTTYYINPVTGASGNTGTSASPLHTPLNAFGKSDVDQVIIQLAGAQAANGAYIIWGGNGWNGSAPTRSLSIKPDAGGRVAMVANINTTAPIWTSQGSNVYSTPVIGSVTIGPLDLHYLDSNGDFIKLQLAANQAAVATSPGSYWYDGSAQMYVQAPDSRNLVGDQWMTSGYNGSVGAFPTAAGINLWIQNIDFIGGTPFIALQPSAPAGATPNLYISFCSFQGAVSGSDGFTVNGKYNVYHWKNHFSNNGDDGLGGHAANGVSPFIADFNSLIGYNGYSTGGSNQAYSIHDSAVGFSLMANWFGPQNQTIRNITNAEHLVAGGIIRAPTETDLNGQTISVQGTSQIWLDGVSIGAAGTFTLDAENTSVINGTNMTPPVTSMTHSGGTGTIQNY